MASKAAVKRLNIEFKSMRESPPPYIDARPTEDDVLVWYYLVTGPPDTPFAGGLYMGELKFPATYPSAPPSIRMLTPSGRFEPGARLCLNMSDFHPESWNPAWNISTILTGLLSFMCSNEIATGAMNMPPAKQREFTKRSVKWNLADKTFKQVFPDVVDEIRKSVPDIDEVATVEVVPPKPSELMANIVRFRATAYKEAVERASNVGRQTAKSESEHSNAAPAPSSSVSSWVFVAAAALLAAGLAFYLR